MTLLACFALGLSVACGGLVQPATLLPALQQTQPSSDGQTPSDESDLLKCDTSELAFPLPADIKECQHLDVVTNFRTAMTQDQVMQFYRDYFQKNGWQPVGDPVPGLQLWTNGPERYQIVVAIEKGVATVQIGGPVKQK